jgi:ribosomal-protein-alanine N-acetyltransferase
MRKTHKPNFTPFPNLITERLTLRQLSNDDQHPIFALRSDAEINKYLGREPSKSINDVLNFINRINENIRNNNSIYWVITLTSTETVVGTICLFDFSNVKNELYKEEENSCEIGFELMAKFQGQGIMKEAAEEVINYAFQTLQSQKIVALTHNENLNSIKLLLKLNFLKSTKLNKESPDFSTFTLTKSN